MSSAIFAFVLFAFASAVTLALIFPALMAFPPGARAGERLIRASKHLQQKTCSAWAAAGSGSWFGTLFGFEEAGHSYEQIKANFELSPDHRVLSSKANGQSYAVGEFSTPSLHELRQSGVKYWRSGSLTVEHVRTGDILPHHAHSANAGATFQAASQFNCLEFASPDALPEMGVSIYSYDNTQGPACSMAAGPATVYRNYFADVDGQEGQTRERQLNNLDELSALLANETGSVGFDVEGGYTFSTVERLEKLNAHLRSISDEQLDALRASIKVGKHSGVQVPFRDRSWAQLPRDQIVSQVFCSAISCAYGNVPNALWEPLATLVLEANYEATLWAAVVDAASLPGASNKVYLTLLGGGVFGNDDRLICGAIQRALDRFREADLHVVVAHYGAFGAPWDQLA